MWQLYAVLGTVVAVGLATMGNIPPAALIARWFVASRGTALGIATAGISISGLVMPPIATALIDRLGWRGGFLVYGAGTLLLVGPLVLAFAVKRPAGLPDDGGDEEPEVDWATGDLLRSRAFWSIALAFGFALSSVGGLLTHLVPHLTDGGISAYLAAVTLSCAAGAGVAGKLLFGRIADRIDGRQAVWLSLAAQLAGLLVLHRGSGLPAALAGAALFGFGMGGIIPLQSLLVARAFGRRSIGRALGLMRPCMLPVQIAGVPLAGFIHDRTGSYDGAYLYFVASTAAAGVVLAFCPPLPR
jgi:predicted MFS family arabinose efflux permease